MTSALSSLVLLATLGQLPTEQASAPTNQASLERIVADLSAIEFSVAVDPPEKLALNTVPVLRWSNPIRNVDDAAVFVGVSKERPEMVSAVMSYRDARGTLRRAYEFLSLSEDRLEALEKGVRVWRPRQPGLAWRPLSDAPAPAGASSQRRRQMRDLAAAFQVAVESDKNRYELRLLSQPLYRYQNATSEILDGALFAFVDGVDPELILILEAQSSPPRWRFATGRLTRWGIEVRRQNKVVAEYAPMTGSVEATDVYLISDWGPLDATRESN